MQKTVISLATLMALSACMAEPPANGKMLYTENCAACHGPSGLGDGPFADKLIKLPSDLTGLSARHDGVYPRDYVLAVMDGFERGPHFSGAMPEFGVELAGDGVMLESGDGVVTPTPKALLAIADYVETLQAD